MCIYIYIYIYIYIHIHTNKSPGQVPQIAVLEGERLHKETGCEDIMITHDKENNNNNNTKATTTTTTTTTNTTTTSDDNHNHEYVSPQGDPQPRTCGPLIVSLCVLI